MTTHGSGIYYEMGPKLDLIPPYDARSGDHFWIVPVVYRVNPVNFSPSESVHLDRENLVMVAGVGCYYCERVYEPRLLRRRCPGEPK